MAFELSLLLQVGGGVAVRPEAGDRNTRRGRHGAAGRADERGGNPAGQEAPGDGWDALTASCKSVTSVRY